MKKPNIKRHEWEAKKLGDKYLITTPLDVGGGMYRVATVHSADHNSLKDTAQAISAVPEMLDALILVLESEEEWMPEGFSSDEYGKGMSLCRMKDEVEKALKKAGVQL